MSMSGAHIQFWFGVVGHSLCWLGFWGMKELEIQFNLLCVVITSFTVLLHYQRTKIYLKIQEKNALIVKEWAIPNISYGIGCMCLFVSVTKAWGISVPFQPKTPARSRLYTSLYQYCNLWQEQFRVIFKPFSALLFFVFVVSDRFWVAEAGKVLL